MQKIGIVLRDDYNINKRSVKVLKNEIVDYLNYDDISLIGIVVNFNSNSKKEFNKVKNIIDLCNGIVMQGGDEVLDIDKEIVKYIYEKDIPILGICLGMQTMALTFNGNLISNKLLFHKKDNTYVHYVNIDKKSKLYSIVKKERFLVNSRHKDYIEKTSLDIVGVSDDNIIEVVEAKNKKFFIGVQWHPESIKDDLISKLLIEEFINTIKR